MLLLVKEAKKRIQNLNTNWWTIRRHCNLFSETFSFNLYWKPHTVCCKSHKHKLLQNPPIKIVIYSAVQAANLRMNICNFGSIYSVICVFFGSFFYLASCNRKLWYLGINKLNTRRTALFKSICAAIQTKRKHSKKIKVLISILNLVILRIYLHKSKTWQIFNKFFARNKTNVIRG